MGLKNPRLIGFGVSNKATLEMVNQHASGAIIGSAFIKTLGEQHQIGTAVEVLLDNLKK
jgi:tryptophan synthase alpha chain